MFGHHFKFIKPSKKKASNHADNITLYLAVKYERPLKPDYSVVC